MNMESVVEIFHEVQTSEKTHKMCTKRLAALLKSDQETVLTFILRGCVDKVLLFSKSHASVDRLIAFFSSFIGSMEEHAMSIALKHICSRFASSNKLVRQRSCQILTGTLANINSEISCELLEDLSNQILPRLHDKIPTVRVWAVKAIKRLQDPSDAEDQVMLEIIRLMNTDNSALVRLAAVESVDITITSLSPLFARLKDIKTEIRVAALKKISSIPVLELTAESRAEVIKSGLLDREEKVRVEAKNLLMKWLAMMNDSVPALMRQINPIEYEEPTQLLGAFVMEELLKQEEGSNLCANMQGSVKESYSKWNDVKSITPAEILWIFTRCEYAQKFCSKADAVEICESILPDAAVLRQLLTQIRTELTVTSSANKRVRLEFVFRYLIRTSALVDKSDVSGVSQLTAEYQALLQDVDTPFDLIDFILNAYLDLHESSTDTPFVKTILNLSDEIRVMDASAQSQRDPGRSIDQDIDEDLEAELRVDRALQIITWAVKNAVGNEEAMATLAASVETIVPFVLESLQQPNAVIRCTAVNCLGLLCLTSQEICHGNRGIILQVASGDFEEDRVQKQALESLVDMALVYRDTFLNDIELCNVLTRLQNHSNRLIARTTSECAARLLFSGVQSSARLFANLLKEFFLADQVPEVEQDTTSSDATRLQQFLSLFLTTFMCDETRQETVVLDSIALLVAEVTMEIKDGHVGAVVLSQMVKHLHSLCDNITMASPVTSSALPVDPSTPSDNPLPASNEENPPTSTEFSMTSLVRERVCAAVCREVMKLNNNKWLEKAITKEFIKLMATLVTPADEWLTPTKAVALRSVITAITNSTQHDKASVKALEKMFKCCEDAENALIAEDEIVDYFDGQTFLAHAPGLADMVELSSSQSQASQSSRYSGGTAGIRVSGGSDNRSRLSGESTSLRSSISSTQPTASAKSVRRTREPTGQSSTARPSLSDSDDSDDDESDSNVVDENKAASNTQRRAASQRSSNFLASAKISQQVENEATRPLR